MKNTFLFQKMKQEKEKITMVTAYDFPSAKIAEEAKIDMILVGDSLGMVVLGYDSTIEVTVDDMIHHGKSVTRGAPNTFKIVDMPFMSYHLSLEKAMENAQKIIQQTNAQALKVEGATKEILYLIQRLTDAGVPVVGHIGLTPQSVHVLGGYRVQGKNKQAAEKLITDAKHLEESGAFSVVLECVPDQLAKYISKQLTIPTIGIGAGRDCDGQVLVYHDILQYGVDYKPSFVKVYQEIGSDIKKAIQQYHYEVKNKEFPSSSYTFAMDKDLVNELNLEE
ncbi:3-methyl-2-oxobutanoate hydroxymethyltransferase [Gracilibacillus boraciitolerans JCM 21714]|uniref:3-methyl-2-oxobutanoate hydroxymethyltransferase n=1 Tax=Gracilibacillus boraciitolerans JCM 21714 TaxID=1298598 RepID=W4VDU7_9BACI|nr:3-methyl-2-oxobutanoate hydroxymethyltransferase [Gracilibacillus boraciitolerans]GAE91392.1 3-methyl-2-oxobutanoate hydroxymethyltransferase [Gracilibacillus boraciitolerans JCM 21714]